MSGIANAVFSVAAAGQQAAGYKAQAAQHEFDARQEEIAGKEEANRLRQRMIEALAAQNALFGASGVTPEGTPRHIAEETGREGDRELDLIDRNARLRAGAARTRAAESRYAASVTRDFGYAKAAVSLFDWAERGGSVGFGKKIF